MSAVRLPGLPPSVPDSTCSNASKALTGLDRIKDCTIVDLKKHLGGCDFKKSGNKDKLCGRLWAHAISCHNDAFVTKKVTMNKNISKPACKIKSSMFAQVIIDEILKLGISTIFKRI